MSATGAAALQFAPADAFAAELLAELHRRAFNAPWDRPWSAKSFAEILAMPGAAGLVARIGDAPIGFGLTLMAADEVELLLLAILPEERKRGLASRLLAELLAQARAAGARRALLEVAAGNAAAIACYRAAGFAECGRRRNYYPGGMDALMFEKILDLPDIQNKDAT
jgi:ribosomal-protein-alanine N-acetyltransferase